MQRGTIIICGNAAEGLADSLYEGRVFVAGRIAKLGNDAEEGDVKAEDLAFLVTALEEVGGSTPPSQFRHGGGGGGFEHLLDGLNPERIVVGMEACGIGRAALRLASAYARERVVFDRPIGANQAIAHPLARAWAELEAAELMGMKAAWLYDDSQPCGVEANAAKLLGADAGFAACEAALQTHGGFGYAREYHVERLWREVRLARLAPVSQELVLNFLAQRALGLPKSY